MKNTAWQQPPIVFISCLCLLLGLVIPGYSESAAYRVGKITVSAVPMTQDDGRGWDALSGPDVRVQFVDAEGKVRYSSSPFQDVSPKQFSLTFDDIMDETQKASIESSDEELEVTLVTRKKAFVTIRFVGFHGME